MTKSAVIPQWFYAGSGELGVRFVRSPIRDFGDDEGFGDDCFVDFGGDEFGGEIRE